MTRNVAATGLKAGLLSAAAVSAVVAMASPALAMQDPSDPPQSPPSSAEAARSDSNQDIIVSGTRVRRQGFDAPTPVVSVANEDLEARGTSNLGDYLTELPVFGASQRPSVVTNNTVTGGSTFLNLRGLGATRTLVLVNGRRHVPTTSIGTVDVNVVPVTAIARVDVVTGGVSAAWGSDAVAGVINIIYDQSFDGVRFQGQAGISGHGDGRDYLASFAIGQHFGSGRGHFLLAGEVYDNNGIENQSSRDWGRQRVQRIANPANTGPADGIPAVIIRSNVALVNATFGGLILAPVTIRFQQFLPDGSLAPFNPGAPVSGAVGVNSEGAQWSDDIQLRSPHSRRNALAALTYDLGDDVELFIEASYGRTFARGKATYAFNQGNLTIRNDNAFIPPELQAQLTANNITAFALGRFHRDLGFIRYENTFESVQAVGGLRGSFGPNWRWEVHGQWGRTEYLSQQPNNLLLANFALAVDAVINPATGQPVCRATLNIATLPPGLQQAARDCVPLNLFGEGVSSLAARDYVTGTSTFSQDLTQTVVAAEVQGEIGPLWAGSMSVVFGAEYRHQNLVGVPDEISARDGWLLTNTKPLRGSNEVVEGFAEIVLPVLQGSPLGDFEANAAIRVTDYRFSGQVISWKAGATWEPVNWLRLRSVYSRDIRAPSLLELFSASNTAFINIADPCSVARRATNPAFAANCTAAGIPANFVQGNALVIDLRDGNQDLEPERARTLSAGFVISPPPIPRLTLSVDYFDIRIRDAVVTQSSQANVDLCYGSAVFPTLPCDQITRDASFNIIRVRNTFLNLAQANVRGLDFELAYSLPLSSIVANADGTLRFRGLASYLIHKKDSIDGVTFFDRAGEVSADNGGLPHLRGNLFLVYDGPRFGTTLGVRYIGPGKINNLFTAEDIDRNEFGSRWFFDLSARYRTRVIGTALEFYAGIRNLLDQDPPIIPSASLVTYQTNPALYDVVGRFFYGGVRARF